MLLPSPIQEGKDFIASVFKVFKALTISVFVVVVKAPVPTFDDKLLILVEFVLIEEFNEEIAPVIVVYPVGKAVVPILVLIFPMLSVFVEMFVVLVFIESANVETLFTNVFEVV